MRSILDQVNDDDEALGRAIELTEMASTVGFDWPDVHGVMAKVEEEMAELFEEIEQSQDPELIKAELGDLLFACCNLARHLNIDPTEALQGTNNKFIRRFRYVEQQTFKLGKAITECDLAALDAFWEQAKLEEKKN